MRLRYSMQIAALISTADAAPRQLLSVHECDSLLCTCTPIMCHISDHASKTPHRPIKPHLRRNLLSGIEHSLHAVQAAQGSAHSSRAATLLSIALLPVFLWCSTVAVLVPHGYSISYYLIIELPFRSEYQFIITID